MRGAVDAFRKIAAALARGYVAFGKQLFVRELYGDDAYARFLCKRALGGSRSPAFILPDKISPRMLLYKV